MAKHTYTCDYCKNDFTRNYIISKPRNGAEKHKTYCSKECRVNERAKERTYIPCSQCEEPTYITPYELKLYKNKFCSNN